MQKHVLVATATSLVRVLRLRKSAVTLPIPSRMRWRPARVRAHKRVLRDPDGGTVALTWIRTHDWDADEWRDRAACRDTNPELFFPIGTTGLAIDQIDAARAVCAQCPVMSECLEFALATNQEAGVWGGTTEDERRKLRKGWLAEQRVG